MKEARFAYFYVFSFGPRMGWPWSHRYRNRLFQHFMFSLSLLSYCLQLKKKSEKVNFRSQILECPSIGQYWNILGVPVLPENVILTFFRHASVIQKLTILEHKNGLVLSNTHVPVSGTWSILFPKKYLIWYGRLGGKGVPREAIKRC